MATSLLHAERVVDCPFSVAHEYAEDYLGEAERGGGEAVLRAGPLRRRVAVRFGLRADATDRGRSNDEIVLRWTARTRLLPYFSGTLRMRIDGTRTRMILEGSYVPPGGRLGALFDAVAGRHIAAATARGLLARIGEALAARELAWRRGMRTPT